ncbi:MAG: NAD(P)/FAD-dependent oxidoreductase, partial [Ilumatobacter sp.]
SMQLVPTIADEVESLTVFQRTAQWSRPVPEYNEPVADASHWLFQNVPFYDRWYRFAQFWRYGDGLLRFLRRDPDWPHHERSLNKTNDRHRREITDFIEAELEGRPDLLAKCVPDYPPFAKRILIDNGWFATLRKPNVELVTETIAGFTEAGIRTVDGVERPADVVVMATGFNVTDLAAHIDIRGRDGITLAADWADENPRAHLGMTVPGFPNFFVMYGPNTNMGHGGSGIWLAETQTRYITDLLVDMAASKIDAIDCRPSRRDDYSTLVDELHDQLVWTHPGTQTYYRNRNGQVRSPMPFRLVDYWMMTRAGDLSDFVTGSPAKADA